MKIRILILFFALFAFFQAKTQDTNIVLKQKATYYHDRFINRYTRSGEIFSQEKYTAAHQTIPFGTLVKVTHRKTGRFVIVKVNDRCPKRGVIDLSEIAAKRLDILLEGCAPVTVEVLPDDYYDLWESQDVLYAIYDRYCSEEEDQK